MSVPVACMCMYVYLGGYVHVDMHVYSCGVFCMNDGSKHDFMCMHDYWGMPMWGYPMASMLLCLCQNCTSKVGALSPPDS